MAAWKVFAARDELDHVTLLDIEDERGVSSHVGNAIGDRRARRIGEYRAMGGSEANIERHTLEENESRIVQSGVQFLEVSGDHVVIDITSFPKRFFFPLVKLAMGSGKATVCVTYSVPEKYATEWLAEDYDTWKPLPTFMHPLDIPKDKVVFVGLGFEPHSLPKLLGQDMADATLVLLFPFPPGPPGYHRNWDFARKIKDEIGAMRYERVAIAASDVGQAFDLMRSRTDRGAKYSVVAPYGPKPMSLAMCLFAIGAGDNCAAYYTQPRIYNPDYSLGVRVVNNRPDIHCYLLRLNGCNVFMLH